MVQTRRQRTKGDDGGTPAAASQAGGETGGGGGESSRKRKRGRKDTGDAGSDTSPPAAFHDDIVNVKTARGCSRRWGALLALRDGRRALADDSSAVESNDRSAGPFDCTDLVIPPSHELINREVAAGVERWKDLAARVIVEEGGPNDDTEGAEGSADGGVAPLRNHELLIDAAPRGDKRKQRLLPHNFDFACKMSPTEVADDNEGHHRPKVVSLLDPTQTLDYGEELGRVFRSVRTAEELERAYALGSGPKEDNEEGEEEVSHGCKRAFALKNKLPEWMARYNRMDAHSLGRLRVRKRHSYPVSGTIAAANGRAVDASSEMGAGQSATALQTTIRFEVLRHSQNLKRGSGVDSNRMEVELHGAHHTLLDLHRLLVECSLDTSRSNKSSGQNDEGICAGVFFIQDTFYTCGEIGTKVGETIRQWLDGKESESKERSPQTDDEATATPRRQFLGLSSRNKMFPMAQTKLEDLSLRLGVRYFHMFAPPQTPLDLRPDNVWSLANESAVYVTGIQTHTDSSNGSEEKPPIIIHDTWGPQPRQVCLACNFSLASVVTVGDPLTDGAPPALDAESNVVHLEGVPMCSSCYLALHYQPSTTRGEDGKPSLELRPDTQPGLVFSIEEYQRLMTASSIDEVAKSGPF